MFHLSTNVILVARGTFHCYTYNSHLKHWFLTTIYVLISPHSRISESSRSTPHNQLLVSFSTVSIFFHRTPWNQLWHLFWLFGTAPLPPCQWVHSLSLRVSGALKTQKIRNIILSYWLLQPQSLGQWLRWRHYFPHFHKHIIGHLSKTHQIQSVMNL